MEFKQLEAFVAVVDYNSFTEAARRLFLTQPTVSAHVKALEKELVAELGCVQFIDVAVDQRRVHHLLKLVLGGKDRSLAGHDLLFQLQKLLRPFLIWRGFFIYESHTSIFLSSGIGLFQ